MSLYRTVQKCTALYAFEARSDKEISFNPGDEIEVQMKLDSGWWIGECKGEVGMFPVNYVEVGPEIDVENREIKFKAKPTSNIKRLQQQCGLFSNKIENSKNDLSNSERKEVSEKINQLKSQLEGTINKNLQAKRDFSSGQQNIHFKRPSPKPPKKGEIRKLEHINKSRPQGPRNRKKPTRNNLKFQKTEETLQKLKQGSSSGSSSSSSGSGSGSSSMSNNSNNEKQAVDNDIDNVVPVGKDRKKEEKEKEIEKKNEENDEEEDDGDCEEDNDKEEDEEEEEEDENEEDENEEDENEEDENEEEDEEDVSISEEDKKEITDQFMNKYINDEIEEAISKPSIEKKKNNEKATVKKSDSKVKEGKEKTTKTKGEEEGVKKKKKKKKLIKMMTKKNLKKVKLKIKKKMMIKN
eukprot:TRINITY_DN1337_c1_g1_i2.p1 TRINITY_DN1337_c1_g1~~TRINITY_DN1337_c1_g1_i2.p1  ORF type:complete len:409 (+),score=161.58 TRINITY_DN1337_c1_g1_i2:127-1353(+)